MNEVKKHYLIDDKLVNDIRLINAIYHLQFDEMEEISIVPQNLTHDFLLSNFNIDENILRFYYASTENLLTEEEKQKNKESGIAGLMNLRLRPYPIIIKGAYFARNSLYNKLSEVLYSQQYKLKINDCEVKYLSDLDSYFTEYSKGFEKGFKDFQKDCIDSFLSTFSDKQDYIFKIFEYLTISSRFETWINNSNGFTTNDLGGNIINGYEDGLKQGYYYKAWTIVLKSNNNFKLLFKNYYSELNNSMKGNGKKQNKDSHLVKNPELKDLFVVENCYNKIIDSLVEKKFITVNKDGSINFKGAEEDSTLTHKKLISTLLIVLDKKDYLEPNLKNTYITKAINNTFKNISITSKTFGEIKNSFQEDDHYSKPFFFIS